MMVTLSITLQTLKSNLKKIIRYSFSIIPYKNDVAYLKFAAITRIYPSYIQEYILFLVTSALPQPYNIYISCYDDCFDF